MYDLFCQEPKDQITPNIYKFNKSAISTIRMTLHTMKTRRSLQASAEGIRKAKTALISHSLTQQHLAIELGISRQPVNKFFQGKPIERYIFIDICEMLNLDWNEIVSPASLTGTSDAANIMSVDNLVQQLREKLKPSILYGCGTVKVLDMREPVELNHIYSQTYILETITGRRWLSIDELVKNHLVKELVSSEILQATAERVAAREAVEKCSKLMILGKPGAGKTTFLKYLAIQCIQGELYSHLIPIFISLKDYIRKNNITNRERACDRQYTSNYSTLLEYIVHLVKLTAKFTEENDGQDIYSTIESLLHNGKFFFLFDGLDEVKQEYSGHIFDIISDFTFCFPDNYFIITSRIAAIEYNFNQFTEVEIADLTYRQITNFTSSWFKDKTMETNFLKCLEKQTRIKELATNPLLLTLLCLAFAEGKFPLLYSEVYREAVSILLKKWDWERGIERDKYKLSTQQKEQLLRQIASSTFKQGEYFFKQRTLEQQITSYTSQFNNSIQQESLQIDSEAILKSIEAQHGLLVERAKGIYSFSHITLHEYFADGS
jgi:predicted NACHT family NTPase